jgi:hypothetical protein
MAPKNFKSESLLFLKVATPMVPITRDAEKLAVAEKHIIQYFFQCTSKRRKMLFLFAFSSFANDDWHGQALAHGMADDPRSFKNYVESKN